MLVTPKTEGLLKPLQVAEDSPQIRILPGIEGKLRICLIALGKEFVDV